MNRGQEWDPCVSQTIQKDIPDHYGKIVPQYWYNRDSFKDEESKYPSPTTIAGATEWLNHE